MHKNEAYEPKLVFCLLSTGQILSKWKQHMLKCYYQLCNTEEVKIPLIEKQQLMRRFERLCWQDLVVKQLFVLFCQ